VEEETVVDVALAVNASTGEFSTLIAALVAADLVETLNGAGPFTVFAPTDAAFAELDLNASNIGTLPVATLTEILLYHVAPARRDAANVTSSTSIAMANGGSAAIQVNANGAFIDDARIVQTDIEASNGIIHVIDAVLMP
jgi:transforming growth factor-beta-induced protein